MSNMSNTESQCMHLQRLVSYTLLIAGNQNASFSLKLDCDKLNSIPYWSWISMCKCTLLSADYLNLCRLDERSFKWKREAYDLNLVFFGIASFSYNRICKEAALFASSSLLHLPFKRITKQTCTYASRGWTSGFEHQICPSLWTWMILN